MNRPIYTPRKNWLPRRHPGSQAARYTHQTLQGLLHSVPVAICVLDRRQRTYLDANESFAALIGVPRAHILNQADASLPNGLGEHNLRKIFACLQDGARRGLLELMLFNPAGQVIKGSAQVDALEYSGRQALVVSFTPTFRADTRPRPGSPESRLSAASEISKVLAEIQDVEELYRTLAGATYRILPEVCSVLISSYDTSLQQIVCAYGEHEGQPICPADIPPLQFEQPGKGLLSEVIRSGLPVVVPDFQYRSDLVLPPPAALRSLKMARSGVFVPMLAQGSAIGLLQAHSYTPARYSHSDAALLSLLANTAAVGVQNARLASELEKTAQDLAQTYDATIDGWTRALELRDFTTERHTHRVVHLTLALGQKLGLDSKDLLKVRRGAQLHDIGKMGIPDTILLKPGPLDESEWRVMRRHPIYAYELLRSIPQFSEIIDIPYCHHEKWDGSGYPRRLRGEEIPLGARIFAIVDVWDALSSNRPYRPAWPANQVVDYIRYQSNRHFEPEVARAFLDMVSANPTPVPAPGSSLDPLAS